MAEVTATDEERVEFFKISLVLSALAGNCAGAMKALGESSLFPSLKPATIAVRGAIEELAAVSRPDVAFRLQGVITILDHLIGDSMTSR